MVAGENMIVKTLVLTALFTTVAINPWFAYDPINLPKMLTLTTGATLLLGLAISNLKKLLGIRLSLTAPLALLTLCFIFSFFTNEASRTVQFWGTWGRSTGLLTYLSFIVITLVAALIASQKNLISIRIWFEKLGYFISLYTLLQYLDLDPINWSQKLMVATLGNINFMSSFLGMAAISYASRVLLERGELTQKIHYLFFVSLNLFLIYISKSIQGLGVFLAGIAFILSCMIRRRSNYLKALLAFGTLIFPGLFGLAGTAGLGPLSFLKQETVVFRVDYWVAGINMVSSDPINGIGIDSFGDHYREFRTLDAVIRTGPQRVTNTAHNVLLDISTGAGVIAGLLMVVLLLGTAIIALRGLRLNQASDDFFAIAAIYFGFLVFLSISINQIGVGVWGFLIIGLIQGAREVEKTLDETRTLKRPTVSRDSFKSKSMRSSNEGISDSPLSFNAIIASSILSLAAFLVSAIPNLADARFLQSIKSGDLSEAILRVDNLGTQPFHREILMVKLNQNGRFLDSYQIAKDTVEKYPLNWSAWVQIAFSDEATRQERIEASKKLYLLDPNNQDVKVEFEAKLPKE
jgi:O-antigen ligase